MGNQIYFFLKNFKLINIAQIATFHNYILFEVLFLLLCRDCGFVFLNWELLMIHCHHLNMALSLVSFYQGINLSLTLLGGYFMPFNSQFHLLYSSEEYCQLIGILFTGFAALIESDAEGIGGSGFVECIREHIHSVRWRA